MQNNTIKLYNLIFPIFILFLIPPYLIFAIIGNLLIDGIIVYVVLKMNNALLSSNTMYKTIFKVFLFGFLADIIGGSILIGIYGLFGGTINSTINYFYIWANPLSVLVHLIIIIFTGFLIYLFNLYIFRKIIPEETVIFRLALSLAIITAPWTFLISASILDY